MQAQKSQAGRIRALFLDVDGTLIGPEEQVSPGVRAALQAAEVQGCAIVLSTGRTRHTAEPIAAQLGVPPGYAVVSNGAMVIHLTTDVVIHRRLLPISQALEVVHLMAALGLEPYVYEDCAVRGVEGARVLHRPEAQVGPWAIRPRYRPDAHLLHRLPFAPISVGAFGPPEQMQARLEALRQRLPQGLRVIPSASADHWGLEVFVEDVSKRAGLEAVTQELGLRQDEVMAVGDHLNDKEALAWAGIGVAMGDAPPEVQAIADWTTGTLAEDGVAQAIHRFVLSR